MKSAGAQTEFIVTATVLKCLEAAEGEREGLEAFQKLFDAVQLLIKEEDGEQKRAGSDEKQGASTEAQREALLAWFQERGGTKNKNVGVKDYGEQGLGIVASEGPVEKGEEIFRVPEGCVITEKTVSSNAVWSKLIAESALLQKVPTAQLAFFLLVERMKPKSTWEPYLSCLPGTFSVPLYWSWDELLLLKDGSAFGKVHQMFRNCVRLYAFVSHLFSQNAKALGVQGKLCFRDWRWAMSVVFTRQNQLPLGKDKPVLALIPVWDLCNHKMGGTMTTGYNEELKSVVCLAMERVEKGDQVCIFYGDRSSADLLVNNGFLPLEADQQPNPQDYALVRLALNQNDPLFEKKKAVLAQLSLPTVVDFGIRREFSPVSPALVFARVLRLRSLVVGECNPTQKISDENEADACDVISIALSVQLRKNSQDVVASNTFHSQCAMRLRRIEKRVMEEQLVQLRAYKEALNKK